jgi:hypothetical protein
MGLDISQAAKLSRKPEKVVPTEDVLAELRTRLSSLPAVKRILRVEVSRNEMSYVANNFARKTKRQLASALEASFNIWFRYRLKQFRAIATRNDKAAIIFHTAVYHAAPIIRLN